MVRIEVETPIEKFRDFVILSTCKSFMPREYLHDRSVFPERESDIGPIYVEAEDKITLKKIGEITFVRANNVLGIIYESKSGNTKLRWRQIRDRIGKVSGEASGNSLVNLLTAGVIDRKYVEKVLSMQGSQGQNETSGTDDTGSHKPQ